MSKQIMNKSPNDFIQKGLIQQTFELLFREASPGGFGFQQVIGPIAQYIEFLRPPKILCKRQKKTESKISNWSRMEIRPRRRRAVPGGVAVRMNEKRTQQRPVKGVGAPYGPVRVNKALSTAILSHHRLIIPAFLFPGKTGLRFCAAHDYGQAVLGLMLDTALMLSESSSRRGFAPRWAGISSGRGSFMLSALTEKECKASEKRDL